MKSVTMTHAGLGVALMASALIARSDRATRDGSEAAHEAAIVGRQREPSWVGLACYV